MAVGNDSNESLVSNIQRTLDQMKKNVRGTNISQDNHEQLFLHASIMAETSMLNLRAIDHLEQSSRRIETFTIMLLLASILFGVDPCF